MAKDDVIYIRIPSDLKAKAKTKAEADGRSLSSYIERLIARDLVAPKIKLYPEPEPGVTYTLVEKPAAAAKRGKR